MYFHCSRRDREYIDWLYAIELRSAPHLPLERLKKFDNCVLIHYAQFFEAPCDIAGFAAVSEDGIAKRQ